MKSQVLEWKIENISCWRKEVHSEFIMSPTFLFLHFDWASLYPRGLNGSHNRMAVRLYASNIGSFGTLTFIGPNGSEICKYQVNVYFGEWVLEEGPEFEKVLELIRKGGDKLTLRLCFPNDYDNVQYACTSIYVINISLTIDPKSLEGSESENSSFVSFSNNEYRDQLEIKTVRTDGRIKFVCDAGDDFYRNISVECSVNLLKHDGSLVRHGKKEKIFSVDSNPWIFSDSLLVEELVNQDIFILINVKIINETLIKSYNHLLYYSKGLNIESDSFNSSDDSTTKLQSDFKSLYRNPDFSDFRLVCDNVTFPVHRNILSARSPVFKSMFSREVSSGRMGIVDLDSTTLACLLEFLYSGETEDLQEESALKLYHAADKYQVSSLKKDCTDFLCDNVCISNVCEILSLANKHQDGELFSVVNDFILNNLNEVLESEEWKRFTQREPLIATEARAKFIDGVGKIDIKSSEISQTKPLFSTCTGLWW